MKAKLKTKMKAKIVLLGVIAVLVGAYVHFDLGSYLTLDALKHEKENLNSLYEANTFSFILLYLFVYVFSTALSIPGATILTLAGGLIFGLWRGLVIISFASTLGATLAMLLSRYLLRDWVTNKLKSSGNHVMLEKINKGLQREGSFYLFSLRLIPAIPFWVINLVMGLTTFNMFRFFIISQIGMLPGTFAYVNAGTELGKIDSLSGILSPGLIFSFVFIAILPIFSKWAMENFKKGKIYKGYSKPKSFDYNIAVIGAGSGGLVSAYISAAVKSKVALIEKSEMGGDCLNTGCVPSKALIRSAKFLSEIKKSESLGIRTASADFEFSQVMDRIQRVIKTIEPHDSVERYSGLGVDCYMGAGKIKTPWEVEVKLNDGTSKTISAKNIIIATGAGPLLPPIEGLKEVDFLTTDTLWKIRELPKDLLILGGGPIGAELAQCFARFGSKVTLVEMAPRILIREDDEVSDYVIKKFEKEGIRILTSHKAKSFKKVGEKNILLAEYCGKDVEIEYGQVLVALGRSANVKGFGLEELSVTLTKGSTIEVDPFLRTNFPNIFACGDVAGPYQFTHTAAHQAYYAVVNSLFGNPFYRSKVDYSVIPWATYTDPEVSRVGLNEKEAIEKGISYEVTTYGIDDLDRAIADEQAEGLVKVITPKGSDQILGVTIVGSRASDIISEFILAMKYGLGLKKILGTIHIYPTHSEANKFAAGNWSKAHVSEKILSYLEKFHAWRRS